MDSSGRTDGRREPGSRATMIVMASWGELEMEAPDFADAVRRRFESHAHHVLGTLRADGRPRLSGIEAHFHDDTVWLGMMPGSIKARDLRRDPRCALHSAPLDVTLASGDARLSGLVVEVTDGTALAELATSLPEEAPPGGMEAFVVDLGEATLVTVRGDRLHVATWRPGDGVTHVDRA